MGRHARFQKPGLGSTDFPRLHVPRTPEANCGNLADPGCHRCDPSTFHFSHAAHACPRWNRLFRRSEPITEIGARQCTRKAFPCALGTALHRRAVFILIDPVEGEISLTLFAGLVVLVEGIMELAAGATSKGPMAGLVLLDGLLSAGIGLLLLLEWPSDSVWALGTLFGITLFSSAVKLLQKPSEEPA